MVGEQRRRGHVMVVRALPDSTADWRGAENPGMLVDDQVMMGPLWAGWGTNCVYQSSTSETQTLRRGGGISGRGRRAKRHLGEVYIRRGKFHTFPVRRVFVGERISWPENYYHRPSFPRLVRCKLVLRAGWSDPSEHNLMGWRREGRDHPYP